MPAGSEAGGGGDLCAKFVDLVWLKSAVQWRQSAPRVVDRGEKVASINELAVIITDGTENNGQRKDI